MIAVRFAKTVQIVFLAMGFCANVSAEDTVPKDAWVKAMRDALPAAFCTDNSYFRSCFKIQANECHQVATQSTASCLRQHDAAIPKEFVQPNEGALWGEKVGNCAGTVFFATLREKFTSNAKCNDASAWK